MTAHIRGHGRVFIGGTRRWLAFLDGNNHEM